MALQKKEVFMAQPINFSINISSTQLVAAVVISQILFRDSLMNVVGKRFKDMFDTVCAAGKNLVLESPVIALATGLTYAVHQLTPYAPYLELSTEGSMKAAAFVGGVFALKSALTPLLEKTIEGETDNLMKSVSSMEKKTVAGEYLIRNALVLQLFPLALGTLYAYYASVPVKLAQSALYTVSLLGVVKLLGKGVEYICSMNTVKEAIQNWYFGLNE
jgi:hypothetical protein